MKRPTKQQVKLGFYHYQLLAVIVVTTIILTVYLIRNSELNLTTVSAFTQSNAVVFGLILIVGAISIYLFLQNYVVVQFKVSSKFIQSYKVALIAQLAIALIPISATNKVQSFVHAVAAFVHICAVFYMMLEFAKGWQQSHLPFLIRYKQIKYVAYGAVFFGFVFFVFNNFFIVQLAIFSFGLHWLIQVMFLNPQKPTIREI